MSLIFKPVYKQRREFDLAVLKTNIMVAGVICQIVKNTIGPYSVNKAIIKKDGEVLITSDAVTILKNLKVEHPVAKILIGMAKAQDAIVGDGVATAVIIAGEFLRKGETLIDQGLLLSSILKGYDIALKRAVKKLEEIATRINPDEEQILRKMATTAISSKIISLTENITDFSDIALELAKRVMSKVNGKTILNIGDIKIIKKRGGSLSDSYLVDGYIIDDREIVHPDMPRRVENANIALVRSLELKEITGSWWETIGKNMGIEVSELEEHKAFLDARRTMVKQIVSRLVLNGVNVLFTNKGLDEITEHYLARAGILAVKRVFLQDMNRIAKVTGAQIVSNLFNENLTSDKLGQAQVVEEWRPSKKEDYIIISGCPAYGASSVIIKGGNEYALDEAERSLYDALYVIRNIQEDPRIIMGGGAAEIELSRCLTEYAQTFKGKEQLAIQAYAEALQIVPQTLADNAGLDVTGILAKLKTKHSEGIVGAGVDVNDGKVKDMKQLGIYEPLKVKVHALNAATDVARIVLRIDEIIPAKGLEKEIEPEPEEEKKQLDAIKKKYELES
ncbi:MAG: thermosome subunit alpha [Candidatus Jordarchaeum sp.]|uniref:thermosome subunit alpha n=1 Tax=Candidatus Jordarchaeum sp. TaxID=2823881 RepID=UPI00404A7044